MKICIGLIGQGDFIAAVHKCFSIADQALSIHISAVDRVQVNNIVIVPALYDLSMYGVGVGVIIPGVGVGVIG
jgi:hypothetical protein